MNTQTQVAQIVERDATYRANMSAMIQGWRAGIVNQAQVGPVQTWLEQATLRRHGLQLKGAVIVRMMRRVR